MDVYSKIHNLWRGESSISKVRIFEKIDAQSEEDASQEWELVSHRLNEVDRTLSAAGYASKRQFVLDCIRSVSTSLFVVVPRESTLTLHSNEQETYTSENLQIFNIFGYAQRLWELRSYAGEDDISFDYDSERDFLELLNSSSFRLSNAALVLNSDGTIRAMFQNEKWRLSLIFIGGRQVKLVLLDHVTMSDGVSKIVKFDKFDKVLRELGIKELLSDEG